MDGYADTINAELIDNFRYLESLEKNGIEITQELKEIDEDMRSMPKLPKSIEYWIGSFDSDFKMSDLDKMFRLTKRYSELVEKRKSNDSKIRLFAIENVLSQIKDVIGEV